MKRGFWRITEKVLHFEFMIEISAVPAFVNSKGRCIICDKKLPQNRIGYLKHVGIDHEVIMMYMKEDPAVDKNLVVIVS